MIDLLNYGYNDFLIQAFIPLKEENSALLPARITAEHKNGYLVITEEGEVPASLSGKYRLLLETHGGKLVVGDFVAVLLTVTLDRAVITAALPRKSCFYRTDGWSVSGIQLLGANIDTVFICMSLNQNFNLRRLERYVIMAKASEAEGVILLTKADLCADVEVKQALCEAACPGIPVLVVSAQTGQGLEQLQPYLAPGQTVAALGSSGVGKSTLLNRLCGGEEVMKTAEVREDDDMGRHTTVHRQLILLPGGAAFLDTPGMRELGVTDAEDAVSEYFSDIEALAETCRFADCCHKSEPGCAVRKAIADGTIEEARLNSYVRYQRQARYSERKERMIHMKMETLSTKSAKSGKRPRENNIDEGEYE